MLIYLISQVLIKDIRDQKARCTVKHVHEFAMSNRNPRYPAPLQKPTRKFSPHNHSMQTYDVLQSFQTESTVLKIYSFQFLSFPLVHNDTNLRFWLSWFHSRFLMTCRRRTIDLCRKRRLRRFIKSYNHNRNIICWEMVQSVFYKCIGSFFGRMDLSY